MSLFQVLLITHIATGTLSLVLGLYLVIAKKGTPIHKRTGKIYFFSMLFVSIVALPMSYLHPNYFLFLISIFTIYMLLTGIRYLDKKSTPDVKPLDWAYTIIISLFAVLFITFGISSIVKSNLFGIVFIVFGCIGLLFSYQDRQNFKGHAKIKNYFLTTHLQRMTGSYVAATTAFLVVNNKILPSVVAWLLPTIIMAPLIIKWTRKYKT